MLIIFLVTVMNKKNHFENTMMDERLISEYKDEIKYEIADNLAIELAPDAVVSVSKERDLIKKTQNEILKPKKNK